MALVAAMVLSACGSDGSGSEDLDGKTFTSQTLVIDGAEVPAADGQTINVSFADGSISVNAGCNTLFGQASWADGQIELAAPTLASTMMACSEPLMAQDQLLITFFSSSPSWSLAGETLTVSSDPDQQTDEQTGINRIVFEQTP